MCRKGGAPYGPSKAGHEALVVIMAQELEGKGHKAGRASGFVNAGGLTFR